MIEMTLTEALALQVCSLSLKRSAKPHCRKAIEIASEVIYKSINETLERLEKETK